jgi:hypothetical protein
MQWERAKCLRRMRARLRAALAGAALAVATAAVPPAGAQESAQTFDIPAQALSGALVEYSRQSGVVVVAPAALVTGKHAPAVRGALTAPAALQRLLSGSGLAPQRRPEGGLVLVVEQAAENAAADEPGDTLGEIIVTGRRLRELTQSYANAIALAAASTDQHARWNFRICPSVVGLEPAEAQRLIDHIARRAYEVGVRAEQTGCQPNLVIIFAPDSQQLAQEIVATRPDLLGYYGEDGVITAGRDALADFVETPRPVRWWHISQTTAADGQRLGDMETRTRPVLTPPAYGPDGVGGSNFTSADGVRSQGTRLRRSTRQDLSFALIIVDAPQAAEAPPQAVADYLTMAALVQLDPAADMSAFSSILNLFAERRSGEPAPVAMTVWDLAYLQGLYGATREAASASRQRADIARRMAERVQSD